MWVIDGVVTVFLAVCSAAVAEGITWLLMYRTERYIKLNSEIKKQSKRGKCLNCMIIFVN